MHPRGRLVLLGWVLGALIAVEGALPCALVGGCAAVWVGCAVQLLLRVHNAAPSAAVG